MNTAIVTLSFDDGDPRDLRIAQLLDKYGLRATFYVPITNVEGRQTLSSGQIMELSDMGFEIGAHTYHHHYLDSIPASRVHEEIYRGKVELERIVDRPVTCFCYPGGKIPAVAVSAVRQLGFIYARTIRECRFTIDNPLLAPTTNPIGKHCRRHYAKEALLSGNISYIAYFAKHQLWNRNWLDYSFANLEFAIMTGGICHLWGHAFEIDRDNEWERLERLFARIELLQSKGLVTSRENSRSFHNAGS